MTSTVLVNGRTVVHHTSDGFSLAAPDLCRMPNGAVVPFANIAFSRDAAGCAATVYCDNQQVMTRSSYLATSFGDEPGSGGGVVSTRSKGKASFYLYSFDVKFEGEPVPRALDPMMHNHGSPWNALSPALMQGINPESVKDALCKAFCTCLAVGGRTHCVRTMAADPKYSHGTRYWDPKVPGLYPEVPFHSDGTLYMSDQTSSHQKDDAGNPMRLPCGDRPPIKGSRRPDFVLAKDGSKPLDDTTDPDGNIAAVYEIKFPKDNWRPGQKEAYEEIAKKYKAPLVEISLKECENCEGESKPEWSQPVDPDEEERESEEDAQNEEYEEGDYGKETQAPNSPGQDAFDWAASLGLGVAIVALWKQAAKIYDAEKTIEQATGKTAPELVRIAIEKAPEVLHRVAESADDLVDAIEDVLPSPKQWAGPDHLKL